MKVLAFDLSSSCVGVLGAVTDKKEVKKIKSHPIKPKRFDVSELGFLKTKQKIKSKKSEFPSYVKYSGEIVSREEKKKRDSLVRHAKNDFVKREIVKEISFLVDKINPDQIIAEKNEIFNGVLTSVLLGEIMGCLEGICGTFDIPLLKIPVQEARKPYNPAKLTRDFAKSSSPEFIRSVDDVTKEAFRWYMEGKYDHLGLKFQTSDESDACVVFDYWFEYVFKKESIGDK